MQSVTPRQLRNIQIALLEDIFSYCCSNHLRIWLAGGTLLGAVRHKGFIPWDDDIDLEMPREDYEKLLRNFPHEGEWKIVSHKNNQEYYQVFAKIYDKRTILQENISSKCPIGVNLDIFPLDNLSDDFEECLQLSHKLSFWQRILKSKLIRLSRSRSIWKNVVLGIVKVLSFPFSLHFLLIHIDKLAQKYAAVKDSEYVGALATQTYGRREIMKREWFVEDAELEFEGKMYRVPSGYHHILTQMYDDYMTPPPAEKQVSHHGFTAYWKE